MSIIDDGVEFETIWDGAHHGKDLDLFRRIEEAQPVVERPLRVTRAEAYDLVLSALQAVSAAQTAVLRKATKLTPAEFEAGLNKLRREKRVESPERGVVQLVRSAQVAA